MNQSKRIADLRQKWQDQSTTQSKDEQETQIGAYESPFVRCSPAGEIVKRFTLHQKNGRILSVPYALLPLFELQAEGELNIVSTSFRITIKGRNLRKLMDWFCKELIHSISESRSGIDSSEENEIFISSVGIEGKLFE